jgi:hypothetical protein
MTGGKLRADPSTSPSACASPAKSRAWTSARAVFVRKGSVLAVEAFEGTDDMLARANKYKTDKLIFVKTPKPRQDWRFDVPVFGMKTVETMHASGITTACLEVDGTIMLEKDASSSRPAPGASSSSATGR